MENTKITGNEPYFPTPVALGNGQIDTPFHKDHFLGITIRQKFIMDYITSAASNPTLTTATHGDVVFEAGKAFQMYLAVINDLI